MPSFQMDSEICFLIDETRKKKIPRYDDEPLCLLSTLPESVIHHILSFLPFKEIVRTNVLSKAWKRIWSNYPNIDLDLDKDICTSRGSFLVDFLSFAEQCLLRKVCIQKMHIRVAALGRGVYPSIMDYFFEAAVKRNVSELVIQVGYYKPRDCWYSVFPKVFVAGSLRSLEFEGCLLGDRISSIDLPHLHKLKLHRCRFQRENVLPVILRGCPKMEFLEVSSCEGVGSSLSIPGTSRLKCFRIRDEEMERFEAFAPSLERLDCFVELGCSIDLIGCAALKHLELRGAILSADYVWHLLSELLCVEELRLSGCQGVDKFQISSSRLKRLIIEDHGRFSGAEIDTPNLRSLRYSSLGESRSEHCFYSWNAPKVEEVHMVFFNKTFKSAFKGGLKGFLGKLQNYEDLKLVIGWLHEDGGADFIMHEKLHAVSFSSLSKFVKRVNPTYVTVSSRRDATLLVHALDSWHGPENLSLISSSRRSIELMHKKLSNRESLKLRHSELKLVSIGEIEHQMDSAFKSFVKTNSNGYHTAGMVYSHREEFVERCGAREKRELTQVDWRENVQ